MISLKDTGVFTLFDCVTLVVFFLVLGMGVPGFCQGRCQGLTKSQGVLEISFEYERQKTIASNQFALWIEDAKGNLVKTIYVTRFTGRGGYEKRPECLPEWVKKANPPSWTEEMIDVIATATPKGGPQVYTWDGHDEAGNLVAPGEYRFVLEANLFWSNRVVYSGVFHYGGESESEIPVTATYFEEQTREGMIKNVRAKYTASEPL
ncbi:MAG: DUF2271 domain-containing protein [Atribacterota bacterium]|nr:DUF2271 domain-containing protein [Atribacterota bacterium]